MLACFDKAFGAFDCELCDTGVTFDVAVVGASHQFGCRMRTTEIGDLFRAFVDKENDHLHLRMILCDRLGDVMQQRCLASARRGDNQTALAHTERRHQIHDAGRVTLRGRLQFDALVWINRR